MNGETDDPNVVKQNREFKTELNHLVVEQIRDTNMVSMTPNFTN